MTGKIDEAAFYKGLYEAIINKSVNDLLRLSYSIWHMPLSMIDIDYNVLGMYPEEPIGDETYDSIVNAKRIDKSVKQKFIDERYLLNLHKCTRPFVLDWGVAIRNHRYSFKLSVDGIIYGAMSMVLLDGTRMDDEDGDYYLQIALAAAKILSQSKQSGQISATNRSLVIRFLLDDIHISDNTVKLYLDEKHDEGKKHLLVLAVSEDINSPFYAEDIIKGYRAFDNERSYINLIDDKLYILLNAKSDEELIEREFERAKKFLSGHGDFKYYISSPFDDITMLPIYRDEVDFLTTLPGKELSFQPYRTLYLASSVSSRMREGISSKAKLRSVREYDRKYGTSLLDTLKCYLENLLDSRKTSTSLNIHRNTLLNRLKRIQEISSLDLSDKDDILESIVYLVIEKLDEVKNTRTEDDNKR